MDLSLYPVMVVDMMTDMSQIRAALLPDWYKIWKSVKVGGEKYWKTYKIRV